MAVLYNWLAPKLLAICLRYVKDRAEAEDILQDSMVKIFTKLNAYRFEGSFEGWAKRIAANTALTYIQKNNKIKFTHNLEISEGEEMADEEINLIDEQDIFLCLNELPLGYRTILNLFLFEDFTHKEISEKLGITESTSRSQYTRARRLMATLIKEKIKDKETKLV
ncbi:MAG: sigma-70 family RNA polymerase sigma factor [Bacteroidia bacterium]|nr:sigma-70 family RNA polymerase sigma factor [Bacteroidia bacterium]